MAAEPGKGLQVSGLRKSYRNRPVIRDVALKLDRGEGELAIEVARAEGTKCERCWKYTTDVGANAEYPAICAACAEAVEEIARS